MYNGETVVSRVGATYYIRIALFSIAFVASAIKTLSDFISYGHAPTLGLTLILAVTGALGRIFYVGKIKRITVCPDYLMIDYVGHQPQDVIDYSQIAENHNLSYADRGSGYRKQVLDLDDGRQIIYTSMKFENYDELKNHIYRYMIAANQHEVPVDYRI